MNSDVFWIAALSEFPKTRFEACFLVCRYIHSQMLPTRLTLSVLARYWSLPTRKNMAQKKVPDQLAQEPGSVVDVLSGQDLSELQDAARGSDFACFEDSLVDYQQPFDAVWSDSAAYSSVSTRPIDIPPGNDLLGLSEMAESTGVSNFEDKLVDYPQPLNAIWSDKPASVRANQASKLPGTRSRSFELPHKEGKVDNLQAVDFHES